MSKSAIPPVPPAQLSSHRVRGALRELGFDKAGVEVTAEDLAKYLKAPLEDIERLLNGLEARRVIKRKRKRGSLRIEWMPWKGQVSNA